MKLFKLLALFIILTIQTTALPAFANTSDNYYRITERGVYFNASPSPNSALFELPTTYYVKKIGETGDYYHVECFGNSTQTPLLDGYVLKSAVTESPATDPYLTFSVTTANSAVLYEDKALTVPIQYIFKERTLGYYGMMETDHDIIYMVSYNGKIGYIKEDDLTPFTVPTHPTPLEDLSVVAPENPLGENPDKNATGTNLKVTVIVALALATLIIIALIVVPERKNRED
jgi:hypothetical protein